MDSSDNVRGQYAGRFSTFLASYISGYVDGEGCFTVSFSPRSKLRAGWEVRPSFSVSQNADRAEVLELMLLYFGCGGIRPDRSDRTLKFEVRDLGQLVERVIPHFQRYPLLSSKRSDFQRFAKVCDLVRARAHLTPSGLRAIVELALVMNGSGRRKFTAEQLLGASKPEVIVSASSNGGSTRSSDPHEWCNELDAVSGRDSAKLQYL